MFAKRMLIALCLVGFLVSVSMAAYATYDIKTEPPKTICKAGATMAIARQAAEDAVEAAVDDFEDGLTPPDFVTGVLESPGTWDGNEYCITYRIVWVDN